ncbi:glycosyltransferase family 2 protein [Halomonas sp. ATBC28]|uniref:glycosyltransferase family 2 protein n=1 Tax=unclassified Halomonas TaxID=2609666 RepID=UPI00110E5577|nr:MULTISPECIES: glycosyltransferase family A protein [unclassified Halomonas]TMU23202.1 glycosyltransferase family 2 protein [Halomonas sp. ATBC28]
MNSELLKQSPWFDADWYCDQYPDVRLLDMAPEEHYLLFGESQGRQPGPTFAPKWYLAKYPDVAQAGVSPLLHFIVHGEQEGRLPCSLETEMWEAALWRQEKPSEVCLKVLQTLLENGGLSEASWAGFALGRWHACQNEWAAAGAWLARRPTGKGTLPNHSGPALLTVEAFGRSGQLVEAWQAQAALQKQAPEWADTRLAESNLLAWQAEAHPEVSADQRGEWQRQRLMWINSVWNRHSLTEVELADPTAPLSLDNLTTNRSPVATHFSPLITVIVPAFKAANTLPTALHGLASQRGVNLEVIVVDDTSPDDTAEVAEAFAEGDARFRVIRQSHNQGAYVARNRGLSEARGEYITVHDSDDWSHPDKLATQLAGLQTHPEWQACCSHWVRCSPELVFTVWRMDTGWTYRNVSSLMFRRQVFEALGYWDRVRVEADTEYYYRIRAAFGDQAIGEVLPKVPLAFGRVAADSLTSVGTTHLVSQYSGVRADYREASQAWHRANAGRPERLYLPAEPGERPFAVPVAMLP